MDYDFIIVGAGAAGLFSGVELLKREPKPTVVLLEKYNYIGGRVLTYRETVRNTHYQWEEGAGRIGKSHTMTHQLIKKYDLHTYPIGNGATNWYNEPNTFLSLISTWIAPLQALSPTVLKQATLGELLMRVHGPKAKEFYIRFPYWAEMHVLRADLALQSFLSEFGGQEEFSVIAEGFQAITDGLKKEFITLGGDIQMKAEAQDVLEDGQGVTAILKDGQIKAKRIILALPSESLKALPSIRPKMPVLQHLAMSPLVRMYAVFPVTKGQTWFSDMPSTVVHNKLRYIIPVNSAKGIIMISYTDGADARHWMNVYEKKGLAEVKRQIMSLIRHTFPHRSIPEPHTFKIYPWSNGCTYWTPGLYCPKTLLSTSYKVTDRVFACGESLAYKQCWVESALESAANMLKEIK